jgi:hypothetical protein
LCSGRSMRFGSRRLMVAVAEEVEVAEGAVARDKVRATARGNPRRRDKGRVSPHRKGRDSPHPRDRVKASLSNNLHRRPRGKARPRGNLHRKAKANRHSSRRVSKAAHRRMPRNRLRQRRPCKGVRAMISSARPGK